MTQPPGQSASAKTTAASSPTTDDARRAALRRSIYALLIVIGIGGMLGRIFAVNSVNDISAQKRENDTAKQEGREPRFLLRPFLSGNDRSRWDTVRSLVEFHTYQIDDVVSQLGWDTIDMVKHDGHGNPAPKVNEGHLYSSKPPLLATLVAGPYWVIYRVTGATLGTHPYAIGRALLVLVNVLPALFYFMAIARMIERYGTSDWGRIFVMAAAVFGTFLSTFVIVLTNHLPAAFCTAIALDAALRIYVDGSRRWRDFFSAGFFAALAAANELPALSICAVILVAVTIASWRRALIFAWPSALLVAAGFFGTNYLAHETLRPAYSQRHEEGGWYDFEYKRGARVLKSYFSNPTNPIDQGEPDRAIYAFHALIGHHGIFSLTPIWLLSLIGAIDWLVTGGRLRGVTASLLLVTAACIAFYLTRPLEDRNYGGMSSGFRWAFWMAPLWQLMMLPIVDRAARSRIAQGVCLLLLMVSVVSVSYPTWNPWVHPWLFDYLQHLDLVGLGPR